MFVTFLINHCDGCIYAFHLHMLVIFSKIIQQIITNPPQSPSPYSNHSQSHMGCAVSLTKSTVTGADDDLQVSVCRERKKLIKSAVDRRYALAVAHCKYNQSLYAVALALRLFVSRHSVSSSSQFLITFPPASPTPTVNHRHTSSKHAGDDDDDGEIVGAVCEHFYDDGVADPTPPVVTSPNLQDPSDFVGWDFFNPFDNVAVNGGGGCEDVRKLKAEDGGGDATATAAVTVGVVDGKVKQGVSDPPSPDDNGRQLLEALKHVEDYFLKAYECGVEFSKMLEFNNVGPLDHLDSKESSEKYIPAITWHKSAITRSRSPSCRSLLSSSTRNSSTLAGIGISNELFDDTGGMESGSHLSTLGRLCAWEKKLYDEVKAGNEMKKIYDRKYSQLSSKNGSNKKGMEDQINDLYSRILVNIKICDSISKRIEKVRDDELEPQIIELLRGLTKTWKVMLDSHKAQSRIMFEVKTFACADLTNDKSRHLATLQLEAEIQNWRMCFSSYITSMEAYIEALSHWAYRTITSEHELDTPPLVFTICRDWSTIAKSLPDQAVTFAMKRFAKDLRTLWAHQEIEQQQKRKVDRLVAESGKRAIGFEREERHIVGYKSNVKNKIDVLAEKKAQLDVYTKMVETEKAKHKDCVEETRRIVLVGFQTGFASIFDSLTEFSEVCVRKYNDVTQNAILGPNRVN